jgi:hypothetical protein
MTAARVQVSADVVFREIEGEAVLLDLASGRYFGLNAVGTRIWAVLSGGGSVDDAVATIVAEFDAPETQITGDVRALVDELLGRGLLVARA